MDSTWKDLLGERRGQLRLGFTLLGLAVTLVAYARFLARVEMRQGVAFIDPVHAILGPVDLTWPIFIMLYGALLLALVSVARHPEALIVGVQAYTIQVAVRMLMMWSLPLDPAPTMIMMADPIVSSVTSGGPPLTRDLFYSGHVAILVVMSMVVPQRWARVAFALLAVAMGVCVILQHVHYTVDVLVAPFVAMACVRFVRRSA